VMYFKYATTWVRVTQERMLFVAYCPTEWPGATFRLCACERKSNKRWIRI